MKRFILLAALLFCCLPSIGGMDLPAPPSGYSWQEIPELKAAFLRPNGWFFRREEQKGTLAYFITKEEIKGGGEFQTGLTVNVFRLKDSAANRGKALIANMVLQHHAEMMSGSYGPFQRFGTEFKDTNATGTIYMHALTIANPKTNTLYLFTFESPIENWNSAWKIGKLMLDALAIDDEI